MGTFWRNSIPIAPFAVKLCNVISINPKQTSMTCLWINLKGLDTWCCSYKPWFPAYCPEILYNVKTQHDPSHYNMKRPTRLFAPNIPKNMPCNFQSAALHIYKTGNHTKTTWAETVQRLSWLTNSNSGKHYFDALWLSSLLLLLVVVMVVVRLEQVMKIYCISFTWVLIRNRRRPRDYLQNPSEIEPYYKIKSLTAPKLPLQNNSPTSTSIPLHSQPLIQSSNLQHTSDIERNQFQGSQRLKCCRRNSCQYPPSLNSIQVRERTLGGKLWGKG